MRRRRRVPFSIASVWTVAARSRTVRYFPCKIRPIRIQNICRVTSQRDGKIFLWNPHVDLNARNKGWVYSRGTLRVCSRNHNQHHHHPYNTEARRGTTNRKGSHLDANCLETD